MNMIVMIDATGCIGINGDQPVHLVEDLKRFKKHTVGNIVVCGRKTIETFPEKKPLPDRSTIVISKTLNPATYLTTTNRSVLIMQDPFDVVKLLKDVDPSSVWVIGGASIYKELLPWTTRVFVTQVHTVFANSIENSADLPKVYFPIEVLDQEFEVVNTTNIEDYDRITNKKYKTTYMEYVRL